MLIKIIQQVGLLRKIVYTLGASRSKKIVTQAEDFLGQSTKIIDIGAGVGNISEILLKKGKKVTAIDVQNLSMVKGFEPIIYDGKKIPFKDSEFDIGLLITVLHHVSDQDNLISEAMRVSNRVIIMEDVFSSVFTKYVTFFFDSLLNFEFLGHPHSNRTDKGWKDFFNKLGLNLLKEGSFNSYFVFRHKVYLLEKIK